MNNDTALILLLADRQREIEALRARVAELEQACERLQQERAAQEEARATVIAALRKELDELREKMRPLRISTEGQTGEASP